MTDFFLPRLATKCACLNDLLHKDKKWHWTKEHSKAVEVAKETALSSVDTYDPKLPLTLACDASPVGVGAVLSQHKLTYSYRAALKAFGSYQCIVRIHANQT